MANISNYAGKARSCSIVGHVLFNDLFDIKDQLKKDLSLIFKAEGCEEVEEIKTPKLQELAQQLEDQIAELGQWLEEQGEQLEKLHDIAEHLERFY